MCDSASGRPNSNSLSSDVSVKMESVRKNNNRFAVTLAISNRKQMDKKNGPTLILTFARFANI